MYEKGRKAGTVRFSVQSKDAAKRVELVASFTDWQPVTMRKGKGGAFAKVVELDAGAYEYKFIMDGQWQRDPDHSDWAMNPYGTFNSVAVIA